MFTQFNRSIRLSFNENPKHWAWKNILLCMFEYKIVYKFECRRRIEIYTCDYPMNSVLIWSLTRRYINIEGMVNEYNLPQLISCVQFFFCLFVLNIKLWMNKKKSHDCFTGNHNAYRHNVIYSREMRSDCNYCYICWMRTWHIITTLLSHIPHSKYIYFFYITTTTKKRNKNHNRLYIYVDDLLYMANIKREKCNFLTRLDNGALRYMWNIPYNKLHAWWTSM